MTTDTLFGAPLVADSKERSAWIYVLAQTWRDLAGRPIGQLEEDLRLLGAVFGHGVSARTVRQRVAALPPTQLSEIDVPSGSVLFVDGCALITPEGRILFEVLTEAQSHDSYGISPVAQVWALQTAVDARAGWYASWAAKQFDGQLSAPALAAALFLLVNGSVGQRNALVLPRDPDRDLRLGGIVLPILGEFGAAVNGRDELDRDAGLRQHWAFTQVSRHLGRDIARESTADSSGTLIYVREGREQALTDAIAVRLQRLAPVGARRRSVERFLNSYRTARPTLAALGMVHEDPTVTHRIVHRVLADEADA